MPSLAASIFSCRLHLARRFWNHTWKEQCDKSEGGRASKYLSGGRALFYHPHSMNASFVARRDTCMTLMDGRGRPLHCVVQPFLMAVGQLSNSLSLSLSPHLAICYIHAHFLRHGHLFACWSWTRRKKHAFGRPAGRPALRSFPRLRVRPPPPPTRSLLSLMKSKWQFRSCTMVGRGRSV